MTFACTAFSQQLQIRNASDGSPVAILPLASGCNSGVVVAENFVIIGEGEAENSWHSGAELFTPSGDPPTG